MKAFHKIFVICPKLPAVVANALLFPHPGREEGGKRRNHCHIPSHCFEECRKTCRDFGVWNKTAKEKEGEQRLGHLDAELGLSPMSALSVVAVKEETNVSHAGSCSSRAPTCRVGRERAYRTELLVRRRIHWGTGRFCFCDLASFCLVRKDLRDCEGEVR